MKQYNLFLILATVVVLSATSQVMNRPIGQYPGNPSEYYGPTLVQDNAYRNLAMHRTVYQSSSWDFNLTSQLLTDGIIDERQPAWLNVSTPEGPLPPHKREACIDGNEWTCNILMGGDTWLQYDWEGMSIDIDEVEMVCSMAYSDNGPQGFCLRLLTSKDGRYWEVSDEWQGDSLPGTASRRLAHSDPNKNSGDNLLPTRNIDHTFHLKESSIAHMRLELLTPAAVHWTITELKMSKNNARARGVLPSEHFTSAWRSLGGHDEWVTVDLGTSANIDKIVLHWAEKAFLYNVKVSNDNQNWQSIVSSEQSKKNVSTFNLKQQLPARYVRVNMSKGSQPYSLHEIEVWGTGGLMAQDHAPGGWQDGRWLLNGGDWRLQRASHPLSPGLKATVPATVLSSYVNAGNLPDMNHDDNLMMSSESFFDGDFIYTRSFDLPAECKGKRVFLNLDGINWKAEVRLNRQLLGLIEGAFKRGVFDITPYVKQSDNKLKIRIIANANPGGVKVKTEKNTDFNGGILGADNPTFHATIGWDWISTIRGRDIGIWDDVYLTTAGDVTVSDPVVTTTLGVNDTLATMTPAVILTNQADHPVSGTLHGHIGDISFEKTVTLAAGKTIEESFSPDEFPQLKNQRMRLWWPNGYGEPYLYNAGFSFSINGQESDAVNYKAGIREVKTTEKDSWLRIYITRT